MTVPILDFSAFDENDKHSIGQLSTALDQALTTHGFVALQNIGLTPALRDQAFAIAQAFFAQSLAVKQQYLYRDDEANFGYQPPLSESLDPAATGDLKETFTMRDINSNVADSTLWPTAEFRDVSAELYATLFGIAHRVLSVFARALEMPDDFFVDKHQGNCTTLRYLHYPSAPVAKGIQASMGAGAHTDYGSITLLLQDDVGGLQLQQEDGTWLDFAPVDGAVVINTGDLMAHWTNDRYPSTVHRVLPRTHVRDRYSIAFFVDPDKDVVVNCLDSCVSPDNPARYETVTAGEHILRKISATH